ncbi:aspartate aminotransferase family protein [Streptomyces sp. WI04-05B]|uniref:aminotransferase family protein n=1 Tax=Streptomyces TaxID=1883 RepID=UPI0029B8456E|nr:MULTISPECIES: aminotransferase class III-fold pyridoxal phosphate-dependent enzyme [unclassified Streptomyces]MDX2547620.1 aminotransferase class III-fold pyridoxal phosphate-dependent enzyme [Streptomyces sp. WI04-05B]MDX2590124.1 aminotransferase class III-fold pyridoxal phosphate-dependent enzyme [Streptomyces sp. WI04-05A]MDX3752860.1 aminotransferase class III-fold pyridoxal phosphate-dependent enzyme [Streptomyces sp. AK08-02]
MSRVLRDTLDESNFVVEGTGVRVRDQGGRWYLDARSALWNVTLGYDHPKLLAALHAQADQLPFGTLLSYGRPPAVSVEFAKALAARLPENLRHIRLGSTGSQMTEGAMLLSRFFRHATGEPERTAVISFEGSYHGMGPGATTLSGVLRGAHSWCGPALPDVHHVSPYGDWTGAVTKRVEELGGERVTAVIVEPLMGSVGVIPDAGDLVRLAAYLAAQGIHLIADEVTTGYGRTGHLSRVLQLGVVPDILVLSKGITAGYVPGAAIAVNDAIFDPLFELESGEAFLHGSTTDGHPLAAAVGLAVLEVLYEDGLMATVEAKGKVLQEALEQVHKENVPGGEVSGVGLMQRFRLHDADGQPWSVEKIDRLHAACEEAGLLTSIGDACLWFLPPLVITERECEEIAERMVEAFRALRGR